MNIPSSLKNLVIFFLLNVIIIACDNVSEKKSYEQEDFNIFCSDLFKQKEIIAIRRCKSVYIYGVVIQYSNETFDLNYSSLNNYYQKCTVNEKIEIELRKYRRHQKDTLFGYDKTLLDFCSEMRVLTKIMEEKKVIEVFNRGEIVYIHDNQDRRFKIKCTLPH